MKTKTAVSATGEKYEYVHSDNPPSGAMKEVYFSPDRSYVIGFFKSHPGANGLARLESITEDYRSDIFNQQGGDYWKEIFCWPEKMVMGDGRIGVVVPTYAKDFFFQHDPKLKGNEKQGKWFASAQLMRILDATERGDFLKYLQISLKLARGVRRLHAAGLAHSDLSYKNVLIDPHGGNACLIDLDGLVVPGRFPPDVLGTPDFIAPEVLCDSTGKTLPSQATDKHALAVLIYMYLLHRHPLRGGRFFGPDVETEEEETLLMGRDPLYIEHPTRKENRNMKREYGDTLDLCKPWVDLDNFSAEKVTGSFLANLFKRAFVDGIKEPMRRPIANEWEDAIIKTTDRLQPCSNRNCPGKWYVFDGSRQPRCPFCGTPYKGLLPKLEFYSCRPGSSAYQPENRQLMVFNNQGLYRWHVTRRVTPNERLAASEKMRQGYFQFHEGKWYLVNERMPSLFEIQNGGKRVQKKPGEHIVLDDGTKILFSTEDGGRLALVQMAGC